MTDEKHTCDSGKRVWLNFVNRNLIQSGKLKKLIDCHEITGIVSNGSLIAESIARDQGYWERIGELAMSRMEAGEILQNIVLEDATGAADLLFPVFERTCGRDGFVGIDVSPELAYDVEGLIEEGCKLWEKAGRPNVMIQIPATKEAVPAIRSLLQSGIQVNATLLYSLARYRDIAQAYAEGMKNRLENGMSVAGIASAATFSAHPQLDRIPAPELLESDLDMLWSISSSNVLSAPRVLQDVFQNTRFLNLASMGVQPQLLMWMDEADPNRRIGAYSYAEAIGADFPEGASCGHLKHDVTLENMSSGFESEPGDIEGLLDALQEETIMAQVIKIDHAHAVLNGWEDHKFHK